jgi:hypothetical protein
MGGALAEFIRDFWGNLKDVLLGRPKNKWEVDIETDLKETG